MDTRFENKIKNINGTYSVTVSDGNTCAAYTSVTLTEPPMISPRLMQQANVQSTPNPFTEKTYIRFVLPENDKIQLSVYDPNGKLLRVLADQKVNANEEYSVEFDGTDLADGIY